MAADFNDEQRVKEDLNDLDVIIIGAGLAGLTCAYNILTKKTGLDVLIIEKNNQVGGRILPKVLNRTYHANFLQKHITDLIKILHINVDEKEIVNTRKKILYTKYGSSENLPIGYGAEIYSFLQMIDSQASTLTLNTYTEGNKMENLTEMSVEELLRRFVCFSFARSLCRAYICSTCAIRNLSDISALWLFIVLNGARGLFNRLRITVGDNNQYFIQGGATEITQRLLGNILRLGGKIRYAEPVNEIKFNDDQVYILTEKNNFRCELVVIAVPPPIHNRIIIEPSSECLLNAQIFYTPSKNVLFNVVFKNRNWNDNSIENVMTTWDSNSNLNISHDATRSGSDKPMLFGFLEESNSTHTSREGLFETLNECFKTTEASNYMLYKEYSHLSNDVMNGGSPMSVMMPRSLSNHISYTDTVFGRIFFASSEYASNWPGTIDGAVEAGKVTAYSILYRIRPQALTFNEIADFKLTTEKPQEPVPFKICAIQFLGLLLNVTIFISYLKAAYAGT